MDSTFAYTFPTGRSPERLDRFLDEQLPDLSRSQIKRLIEEGRVCVDGQIPKAGLKLAPGNAIEVEVPPPAPSEAEPEDIPIEILYEDTDLVVVNKEAGMVVHPASGHYSGTLVNALLHHCTDLSGIGGEMRPGIVHRLDKDTSGVMVVAKSDRAHQHLAEQFKAHSIDRRYVALVHGQVQNQTGTIDLPIGRHPTDRKKMSTKCRNGRDAVTHWRVLKRYDVDRVTLVELRLETGRTHQIRVHFSEMNLPLVADPMYSNLGRLNGLGDVRFRKLASQLKRQALHARLLAFDHPITGERLSFESPIPEDLQILLNYLDQKYEGPEEAPSQENNL